MIIFFKKLKFFTVTFLKQLNKVNVKVEKKNYTGRNLKKPQYHL